MLIHFYLVSRNGKSEWGTNAVKDLQQCFAFDLYFQSPIIYFTTSKIFQDFKKIPIPIL